ncbi:MAG: NTP transferase domain-containing protein [Roseiarcus sp.]
MKFGSVALDEAGGAIAALAIRNDGVALPEGQKISAADIGALRRARVARVIAARLEPGDIAEDIAAILLAAGTASRYRAAGGAEASKLIADFHGEPVVRAAAKAALASRAAPLVVVTGYAREKIEAALAGLDAVFVHNADYATGLASSLRAGLAAVPRAAGALVLLGDMPRVPPSALDLLIAAFAERRDALAVIPVFRGERGNPVLLSRALIPEIERLSGDEGARRLLRAADPRRILEVAFDDAAITLDVDTPADLRR